MLPLQIGTTFQYRGLWDLLRLDLDLHTYMLRVKEFNNESMGSFSSGSHLEFQNGGQKIRCFVAFRTATPKDLIFK